MNTYSDGILKSGNASVHCIILFLYEYLYNKLLLVGFYENCRTYYLRTKSIRDHLHYFHMGFNSLLTIIVFNIMGVGMIYFANLGEVLENYIRNNHSIPAEISGNLCIKLPNLQAMEI